MNAKNRTALKLAGFVAVMAVLTFAAVPFYAWFREVTGYGGTPSVASAAPGKVLDQVVTVRFDANTGNGMAWEFRPVLREMKVRIGEIVVAYYEAYNPTRRVMAGAAGFSVAPYQAGGYLSQIDCFCFTPQVLGPGERVRMPVSFFVDPSMMDDPDSRMVRTITLSYTLYETPVPEEQAAVAAPSANPAN